MAREEVIWLSTREAARQLGITPRTLYRLIDDGQVAAHKIGRVIRLKQSDVDDFVERSRITPGELEHLYLGGEDEVDVTDVEVTDAAATDETEVVETD